MAIIPNAGSDRRPRRGVFIQDLGALDGLAEMEGVDWRREQDARPESPYGFHAWKQAWDAKQRAVAEDPAYADEPVASFLESSGDGAIYGAGGWRRYAVALDGELVLMRWSATEEACARAEAIGLRVSGATAR